MLQKEKEVEAQRSANMVQSKRTSGRDGGHEAKERKIQQVKAKRSQRTLGQRKRVRTEGAGAGQLPQHR